MGTVVKTSASTKSNGLKWPARRNYHSRYFVPDLSPMARPELKGVKPKIIFVAESPFESEVAPEKESERRPLCGKAGQEWWRMIGAIINGEVSNETSLKRLLELCRKAEIAVLNSVQYPLDPKIVSYYDELADPLEGLGFTKFSPVSYKKLKTSDNVQTAIHLLRERLADPLLASAPVVSLGLDAQWFVSQALESKVGEGRHLETVPHPSAWWRAGGKFRVKAKEQLTRMLGTVSQQERASKNQIGSSRVTI
jgi:hypothetical protein